MVVRPKRRHKREQEIPALQQEARSEVFRNVCGTVTGEDGGMSARTLAPLAWFICSISVALGIGAIFLALLNGGFSLLEGDAVSAEAAITFPLVGALIASNRPRNAVGWIFCGIGLSQGMVELTYQYAQYGFVTDPGSLPGAGVATWLGGWTWMPGGFGSLLTFLPLLFPNGRLPSSRWRPLAWLSGLCLGSMTVIAATSLWPFRGERLLGDIDPRVPWFEPLTLLLVACGAASAISLVFRFRRATREERQQLKWFSFGVSALAVLFVGSVAVPDVEDVLVGPVAFVMIPCVPAAAGVAILKHRLYDIDLIINRTLVYGGLTAALALVYFGGVFGMGALLRGVTSGGQSNSLVVAASTLAVAGLFRPARSRIQFFIDRRFYRRKYDAAKTLETFSIRLREQVSIDASTAELLAVVEDTMQPAHMSLWLRTPDAL